MMIGRRLGTVMEKAEFDALEATVGRGRTATRLARDADAFLKEQKVDAMFRPYADGSSTVFVKANATRYEVLHELAHREHFAALGYDVKAWGKLSTLEREQEAFDRLRRSADWGTFSEVERESAAQYLKNQGGKPW